MSLFDLFGRRPPPPAPTAMHRSPIAIVHAPTYQPLPTNSADPVDAEIVRLWAAYQRHERAPTWPGFITTLSAANTDLASQVQRAHAELADYRRMGVFTP